MPSALSCPCIPVFGKGVCGIFPSPEHIQLTDMNFQSGMRHPSWALSTPSSCSRAPKTWPEVAAVSNRQGSQVHGLLDMP